MLFIKRIFQLLLFLIVISGYFADVVLDKLNNYGPYKIEFTRFDSCAGPKSKNLTDYTLDLRKQGEDFFIKINFTYLTRCHIDELKIRTYAVKGNEKSLILNYNINDPCHHYSMATIIENYLESKKCWVEKGVYLMDLNISNISRTFYGKSFFYGEFMIKSVVTSKQGNILCWIVNSIISKDK